MTVAVYDANVLASGFVSSGGPPGRILDAWRGGRLTLVVSDHILGELQRTLQKPYFRARLRPEQISRFLAALREDAFITPVTAQVLGVATHPEDDVVLATAVSGQADYLVTGDTKLQQLVSYRGVTILSPRAFLDVLQQEAG